MGAQAQAPERTMAAVGGASLAMIESLRARLLAERAASKEARENAHKIALKVSELQSRLDAEIEQRKKAEVAMNEVLEVLQAKGVALDELVMVVTSTTVSSESEEAAQLSSSKDAESEHSSGEEAFHIHHTFNQQDSVVESPHLEGLKCQSEAGKKHGASFSGEMQIMAEDASKRDALELENVSAPEDNLSLKTDKYDKSKEGVSENKELIQHEQDVFMAEDASKRDGLESQNVVAPEDTFGLRTDKSDKLIEGMSGNEGPFKYEQDVLIDEVDGPPHASQGENNIGRPSELSDDSSQDQFVEQAVSLNRVGLNVQSANVSFSEYLGKAASPYQAVKPSLGTTVDLYGEQSFAFNGRLPLHASVGHNDVPKWLPPEVRATAAMLIPSGIGDGGNYERGHAAEDKTLRGLLPRAMAPPVRESTLGVGPNYMHPADLSRGAYLYEPPYTSVDPIQHLHYVSQAEQPAPFLRGPKRPATTIEFARFPLQVGVSEDILSLVDDKSGKLGNILMALNLAKQQINDEDCTAAYMEEPYEATVAPGPFRGIPHPDLYEGALHEPPTCQWRFEPQSQVPIVHFPISPRADHEPSPFEAHDRVKLNRSSTSAYHMPSYDPYLQPKGELHLGNGITLYTD